MFVRAILLDWTKDMGFKFSYVWFIDKLLRHFCRVILNLLKIRGTMYPENQGRLNCFMPYDSTGDHVVNAALFPQS